MRSPTCGQTSRGQRPPAGDERLIHQSTREPGFLHILRRRDGCVVAVSVASAGFTFDTLLHRLLPFALVMVFLIASVLAAFASPIVGGVGLFGTMAGVLIAYLTGRTPGTTEN
jgi:hypothetical protein